MIIEDETILSDKEKEIITDHLYKIWFHLSDKSTTAKFPFYAHPMASRPVRDEDLNERTKVIPVSKYFSFYHMLIGRFCHKHGIKYKNIIRACINSTYYFPDYKFVDPHIDFTRDHLVIILYLNDVKVHKDHNSTLIFDLEYDKENPITCYDLEDHNQDDFTILKEVTPKFGKILCFDGKYFHSNKFPSPGENRIVCVFNLLL